MVDFSIVNFNLNGIRAAAKRGFGNWLSEANPQVLLAQEVRATPELARGFFPPNWQLEVLPCDIKGRAGVLIAAQDELPIVEVKAGLVPELENPEDTGRWLEAIIQTTSGLVRVVSAYFHSGEVNSPKQEAKMRHLEMISTRMSELLSDSIPTVVGGDYNVVRSEIDIKNWRPNHNKRAGVLDEEIQFLNQWVESGWQDVTRDLVGARPGPYTWWSWRGKAFDNDAGWRIDYQYATPTAGLRAEAFTVGRANSYDERISDHAPLRVDYTLG